MFENPSLGRASVPASPNIIGKGEKSGLAGTFALPKWNDQTCLKIRSPKPDAPMRTKRRTSPTVWGLKPRGQ